MPRFRLVTVPRPAASHSGPAGFVRVIQLAPDTLVMGEIPPLDYDTIEALEAAATLTRIPRRSPPPPPPARYSKLAIVRTLRAAGLEPMLHAMLESNAIFATDWAAATTILADDPMLLQAIPAFSAQAGISPEAISAMLARCVD